MLLQPPAAVSLAASTWQVGPGKSVAICFVEYIFYNIIVTFHSHWPQEEEAAW